MKNKKILCVIDSLGSGGAQRQLVELGKGLKERGHDVSFLIYHNIVFFKSDLDDADISVKVIEEKNFIKRIYKIRKSIQYIKPDVVISFLEPPSFICEISSLPYKKWKLIVGERSADPKILKSYSRRFYRWMHLFADYVVANSYENIQIVKKINPMLKSNKCKVIYNIIDQDKWKPSKDYLPDKDSKFHLVVASSHQYLKNAKGLIEAVNLLLPKEQNKLRISWYGRQGEDNSYSEALELIEKYNLKEVVIFHPASNMINEIFTNCDAVGLFSYYEGLPNVVCEAMMSGKPVIASRVSDVPILLDEIFTFEPSCTKSISLTISNLLKMNSEMLIDIGEQNHEKAKKYFDKDKLINEYLMLIEKL